MSEPQEQAAVPPEPIANGDISLDASLKPEDPSDVDVRCVAENASPVSEALAELLKPREDDGPVEPANGEAEQVSSMHLQPIQDCGD
jgi:hypothetical protein